MVRRWSIPLATIAIAFGTMLGMAGNASAATTHMTAARPGVTAVHSFTPGGLMARPTGVGPARAIGRGGRATAESTNWSGYAATGSNGAFTSVSGSWTQPTATCSSSGRGRNSDQYAAFWVGLDGFSSDSVEQTGSDSDCAGRTPDYYGWYEMYPAAPVNFNNPVRPGDSMSASVTFSGTETFTLVLKDNTEGWTQTITKNETGLARSSAEIITEAPSSNTGVLPLADFGTINYSASTANGTSLASHSPTEIIMIDNSGQDKDSTGAINSSGGFSNTWLRAN
ncbi:MAG TPA: G1 family glutamic endopeptidase [Streptosporangiaceae bacterium]